MRGETFLLAAAILGLFVYTLSLTGLFPTAAP